MKLKYFTSLLLIASFVGLAIFSFTIFNHNMNHSNNSCLAYTVTGVICPTTIMAFALRYLVAIFDLLLMLGFLSFTPISLFLLFQDGSLAKLNPSYCQRKFIRWLALLENSPSV